MHILAINGSPRKSWNTATLLQKALEGAASAGAGTQMIHLYDLAFKGCISCFACKTPGSKSYGRCGVDDELMPILQEAHNADAIVLGSPIYLGAVTGAMQSFLERLIFPYLTYTNPPQSLFPRQIRTGFIYTLGASEEMARERGFDRSIASHEFLLRLIFGDAESLCSYDTYQFEDYAKVYAPLFDPEKKARRRDEVFPEDCRQALEMGERLVQNAR